MIRTIARGVTATMMAAAIMIGPFAVASLIGAGIS